LASEKKTLPSVPGALPQDRVKLLDACSSNWP
jgi:hypothetical protein